MYQSPLGRLHRLLQLGRLRLDGPGLPVPALLLQVGEQVDFLVRAGPAVERRVHHAQRHVVVGGVDGGGARGLREQPFPGRTAELEALTEAWTARTVRSPAQALPDRSSARVPAGLDPAQVERERAVVQRLLDQVMSGGVSVNDALFHVGQHDLPFGGVGDSGMGHYHGYEGFLTFSKLRPVFYQASFSALKFIWPPYQRFASRYLDFLTR